MSVVRVELQGGATRTVAFDRLGFFNENILSSDQSDDALRRYSDASQKPKVLRSGISKVISFLFNVTEIKLCRISKLRSSERKKEKRGRQKKRKTTNEHAIPFFYFADGRSPTLRENDRTMLYGPFPMGRKWCIFCRES